MKFLLLFIYQCCLAQMPSLMFSTSSDSNSLTISISTNVVIYWNALATNQLQSAVNVSGPWNNVGVPMSGSVTDILHNGMFYRFKQIQPPDWPRTNVVFGNINNSVNPKLKGQIITGGGWDSGGNEAINRVAETGAAIHGGGGNYIQANADMATIVGGVANLIEDGSWYSVIGGGHNNTLGKDSDESSIIAGRYNYTSNTADSFIANGAYNRIIGEGPQPALRRSGILGGESNIVTASYSLAGGRNVIIIHPGSFGWNDSRGIPLTTTGSNQFRIKAGGGIYLDGDVIITGRLILTNY